MNENERSTLLAARVSRAPPAASLAVFVAALVLLSGCGPLNLVATARIPEPLVVKIPVTVALFMPPEFIEYVHQEERWGTDYNIAIGKAQTNAVSKLLNAMFERVIVVDSLNAGSDLGESIAAILEPSVEEFAFVTPRDAGSPFFAVSIKYRVNVYLPDGKLADSWGFTGYGTAPAGGLSNTEPLQNATALAMRDAGAKLAVEFRDQAIVRGLLPAPETADDPAAPEPSEPVPAETAPAQSVPVESGNDTSGAPPSSSAPAAQEESESGPEPEAETEPEAEAEPGAEAEPETETAPEPEQDEDEPNEPVAIPNPEALALARLE